MGASGAVVSLVRANSPWVGLAVTAFVASFAGWLVFGRSPATDGRGPLAERGAIVMTIGAGALLTTLALGATSAIAVPLGLTLGGMALGYYGRYVNR